MPQELIVAAEQNFTTKERELLKELTQPDSTIDVVIPKEIDPRDWMIAATVTCRALIRAQVQEQALLPVLGRLLLIAQENPQIYKDNGYEGFEHFINGEIRTKWTVSRSTCYEAMRVAQFAVRAELTSQDIKEIGRVKLREVVKYVAEGEEQKKASKDIIQKSKQLPVADFRTYLDEKFHVDPKSGIGAWVRFGASKAVAKRWEKFISDPDIQAVVGSGKADKILDKMMEECGSEWRARASEKAAAGEGAAE